LESYLDARDPAPVLVVCGTQARLYPESKWLAQELEARGKSPTSYFIKGEKREFKFSAETKRADLPYLRLLMDFLDDKTNNCGPMEGVCKTK
jgi:hypothetical protein